MQDVNLLKAKFKDATPERLEAFVEQGFIELVTRLDTELTTSEFDFHQRCKLLSAGLIALDAYDADKEKSDRKYHIEEWRFRITTAIAVLALIVATVSVLWQLGILAVPQLK